SAPSWFMSRHRRRFGPAPIWIFPRRRLSAPPRSSGRPRRGWRRRDKARIENIGPSRTFSPMRIRNLHSWDLTPKEAVALQRELAGQVDAGTPLSRCELIAGADVSYGRFSKVFFAGVVVLRAVDLSVVEQQSTVLESSFPFV